jgi:hypothetical protein
MSRLLCGVALLLATDLTAQSIGTRKPATSAKPAANTVALYPLASAGGSRDASVILEAVATRTRLAFQDGGWVVINRSSDEVLKQEREKIQSPEQFESQVKIADGKGLNARYVVEGFILSAGVEPQRESDGRLAYEASMEVAFRLTDVENNSTVSETIDVTSAISSMSDAKGVVVGATLKEAAGAAADKISNIFKKKKDRPISTPSSNRASDAATAALVSRTPEEAWDRVYTNAQRKLSEWARELAQERGFAPKTAEGK